LPRAGESDSPALLFASSAEGLASEQAWRDTGQAIIAAAFVCLA